MGTHSMATRLGKTLTDVRKSGECWWLRPDGKSQVTIQYLQKPDGSVEPQKIHTVVISTQHAEPLRATRRKEVAGYTGADETAPSMGDMNKLIIEKVVKRTLSEIKLKNSKPALTLFSDADTHLYINPSGKFIIGGPQGDAGLTGRKNHHRHLRWLGRARWWRLLRQGSDEGGPVCGLHLPADGKVYCEKRPEQAGFGAAFLCHWSCEAVVLVCGDLRLRVWKTLC